MGQTDAHQASRDTTLTPFAARVSLRARPEEEEEALGHLYCKSIPIYTAIQSICSLKLHLHKSLN